MPVDGGCRDAEDWVNAWIASGFSNPTGPEYIGDGWQLVGTAKGCAPEEPSACQGWTWDFQPWWHVED